MTKWDGLGSEQGLVDGFDTLPNMGDNPMESPPLSRPSQLIAISAIHEHLEKFSTRQKHPQLSNTQHNL
jgi:hypothetical protein